jgi:4-amino-4-deoxy-L-arabinose transferase-like glycosyltransferase
MSNYSLPASRSNFWLYAFITLHVFAWTIIPYLVRYTLPMDAIESTIWGHQLEWGYDKNPFLNGWLTRLAIDLGQHSDSVIYFFSQLSVGICFWAMWELSKKMLPATYAILSILFLEGIQYYNIHAIDFNDNTLELSLWALTLLFFYQALRHSSYRQWLLTGIFAGLSMMTKYYTLMLLLPMALFLLRRPDNRALLKTWPPYVGLFAFLAIVTPHFIWLFFHDFITVDYALNRVNSKPTWTNHFSYPILFAKEQFQALLPALLLLSIIFFGKKPFFLQPRLFISDFNKQFLLYAGIGPFLLTLFLSLFLGIKLRAGWGEPLLSLSGIILIAAVQPRITPQRFYQFIAALFIVMVIALTSYSTALIQAKAPSSANFPGKFIAETLATEWHNRYHTPLAYVAGPRWLAGNIAFYTKDHPAVFINWNKKLSPWINENQLLQKGALFVWDVSEENDKIAFPVMLANRKLESLQVIHFYWLRNKNLPSIEVEVAFLPPFLAAF